MLLHESITPLGDQAALVRCADEEAAVQFCVAVRQASYRWVVDVIQSYTSVAVFFDLDQTRCREAITQLQALVAEGARRRAPLPIRSHLIPCCYEFQQDLKRIADCTGLDAEQVVQLHCQCEYVVYAIGFCPGFPYLGYLPAPLCGVPRLPAPRLRVEQGAVGLTGRQTGIYTLPRPGGWNIVGKTPLQLVDVEDGYFPLRTGDRIGFRRIDAQEFRALEGERL